MIDIGSEIKSVFESTEHTVAWFAKKLNCDRSNVYDIFARKSIDTELLFKISEILHFNFFALFQPEV